MNSKRAMCHNAAIILLATRYGDVVSDIQLDRGAEYYAQLRDHGLSPGIALTRIKEYMGLTNHAA